MMYRFKYTIALLCVFLLANSDIDAQQKTLTGKALFGSLRARHIGPAVMSGRISTLDVVESKPEVLYIGTAGGGIWRSNSAGASLIVWSD